MQVLLILNGAAICPFRGKVQAHKVLGAAKPGDRVFFCSSFTRIIGEHAAVECLKVRLGGGNEDALKQITLFAGIECNLLTKSQLTNATSALACLDADSKAAAKKFHISMQNLTRLGMSTAEQEKAIDDYKTFGAELKVLFFGGGGEGGGDISGDDDEGHSGGGGDY